MDRADPDLLVESFHVNVGAGDSAIHLLTSEPLTDDGGRVVRQAFLIDGGVGRSSGYLEATIAYIQMKWHTLNDKNLLKFNGFVITHWDSDHANGLENALIRWFGDGQIGRAYYSDDGRPLSWIYSPWSWNYDKVKSKFKLNNDNSCLQYKGSDVLRARWGARQLLGHNLFRQKSEPNEFSLTELKKIKTLVNLQKLNPIRVPDGCDKKNSYVPAMYCVAAENQVLGQGLSVNLSHSLTDKNKSSIAFLVVWNGAVTPIVTHYFAGDLHSENEMKIAKFLGPEVISCQAMKLSHHGAYSSNPVQNLETFNPNKIVVSAGSKYGHPRWELLIMIGVWSFGGVKGIPAAQGNGRKPFFPCRWPYYLNLQGDTHRTNDINFEALEEDAEGTCSLGEQVDLHIDKINLDRKANNKITKIQSLTVKLKLANHQTVELMKQAALSLSRDYLLKISDMKPDGLECKSFGDNSADFKMCQVVCVMIDNGAATFIGMDDEEYDAEWRIPDDNTDDEEEDGIFTNQPPFPNQYSKALCASRSDSQTLAVEVDPTPYKGEDQPRSFDLATGGNPNWPAVLKLSSTIYGQCLNDDESGYEADDDWDDMDRPLSKRRVGKPPAKSGASAVLYKPVPPHMLAAAAYIACRNQGSANVCMPQDSQTFILEPPNPLYGFLDTTHLRAVGLATVPDKVKPTLLDPDDELFHWLGRFCSLDSANTVPDNFLVSMSKVSEWPIVTKTLGIDFEMKVPYITGEILSFSTNKGAEDTFSKMGPKDVFNKPVELNDIKEMLIKRRTMVFGLENDKKNHLKTTIANLAKFVRLDFNKFRVLRFLTGEAVVTLDTTQSFRNAIWFRPGMEYQTHMRLQFSLDLAKFNAWLNTLNSSLSVSAVTVIARKQCRWIWASPNDLMDFGGFLAFLCRFNVSDTLQLEGVFELSHKDVTLSLKLDQRTKTAAEIQAMKGSDGLLSELTGWLANKFGVAVGSDLQSILGKATDGKDGVISNDSILPRRIRLTLNLDDKGKLKGVQSVSIDIEACLTVGRSAVAIMNKMDAVFLFTFGWRKGSGFFLRGGLWTVTPPSPFSRYERALPEYEEYQVLEPMTPLDASNQLRSLDLAKLLATSESEVAAFPAGIPNEIRRLQIEIDKSKVQFRGSMLCSKPKPDPKNPKRPPMPPMISLDEIALEASYQWKTKTNSDSGLRFTLDIALTLFQGGKLDPKVDADIQDGKAARLTGEVTYDKGKWAIGAAVYDLSVSHILDFWDPDDRDSILKYLGKIDIDFIKINYEFDRKGEDAKIPSQLKIEGQFTIADVATLNIDYTNNGGKDWGFIAKLGPSEETSKDATVGKVMSSFLDKDIMDLIPGAITEAKIEGGKGEKALRVLCAKHQDVSVFACLVSIGKVSVWFVQVRQGGGAVKRLVKAAISKISVDISAFQTTINSPWEDLFFMWVGDSTTRKEGDATLAGITQEEFDSMSKVLKDQAGVPDEQLRLFKPKEDTKKEGGGGSSSSISQVVVRARVGEKPGDDRAKDAVLVAGSHLVIVAKKMDGKVGIVLDHLFGAKKKKQATGKDLLLHPGRGMTTAAAAKGPDPSGAEKGVKAPFKVKIGPLSIGNVGLWYKNGMIGVNLDATLLMGPLGLSLLGFSIGVPFGNGYSLANPPPPSKIEWGLQGLILAMDKPPLTIAGGFMRDTSDPDIEVMYTGGLIVGFKPWSFEAMGAYANVKKAKNKSGKWITTIDTKPLRQLSLPSTDHHNYSDEEDSEVTALDSKDEYTFAFIYVKLNGPLFSVGFADVAGLVGGFGMNSDITLPTVEQVVKFPFVAERDSNDKSSPVERMQGLMRGPWFRPAEGMYWAAAGARITAFQMIAANIVLVIQFGNGNLLFGIFGVATCDVPSLESPVKFAHVELGIVCTFDVRSGVFKLEAQLSPRSFILAPQCHLTGGMALMSWTKGDSSDPTNTIQAGDWVFTIGGYHRAFHPPSQYPRPPRLGISWSLDSCLSVVGEAYFAITPKVCMGGGRIRASLSLGVLYAWFDAFMDFLMNFEPFFFQLEARVSVGVRFTLDLWLVTIRISCEIGAGLDLCGPPFGGVVHVDFWVFGFDIKFGSPPRPPPPISLVEFWKVATKTGAQPAQKSLLAPQSHHSDFEGKDKAAAPQPDTAAILLTCETGLLPPLQDVEAAKSKSEPPAEKDSKWYVKGGQFSMMATFQVPLTAAKLTETRIETDQNNNPTEVKRYADAAIDEPYKKVYAKPMQLYDPLRSEVAISVTAPTPRKKTTDLHILGNWLTQKWKLTPLIKPVQSSVWGRYDPNQDPSRVKGPIDGLLNGKDATVQLVTGMTIVPPDPTMADDLVNKFNITKDHVAAVFDKTKPEWPLFVGVLENQQKAWEPAGRSKTWDEVQQKWASVGDDTTSRAVDLWAKRLRYDQKSFEADQKDPELVNKFKPIRGVSPKKLLKKFNQLVPALPLIAVGN